MTRDTSLDYNVDHPALSSKQESSSTNVVSDAGLFASNTCLAQWTPTTPTRSSANANVQHDEFFNLFSHSFDSLTDGQVPVSVRKRGSLGAASVHSLQTKDPDSSDDKQSIYSLEDLSPIKMDYSSGTVKVAGPLKSNLLPARLSLNDHPAWGARPQMDESAVSNPFYVLRSARYAFQGCKYVLPAVSGSDRGAINLGGGGNIRQFVKREASDTGSDIALKRAIRRVDAAICAFGGQVRQYSSHTVSIFRPKAISIPRQNYEKQLSQRYFLSPSSSNIHWDVEENPPIVVDSDGDDESNDESSRKRLKTETGSSSSSLCEKSPGQSEEMKMKYRCKLCGRPKQNHVCTHRQSLQRDIGVMVFPAVNSYTSDEPGSVAPPLTKMNNFVSYDADNPTVASAASSIAVVTPDASGGGSTISPQSSLTSTEGVEVRTRRPIQSDEALQTPRSNGTAAQSVSQKNHFVKKVSLRPEHYRSVSTNEELSSHAFEYPPIPLTFAERKKLSDTLFLLSQDVQSMTQDCAAILRQARRVNEWDLAMAELLTQVVVSLYCGEGDTELIGLRDYLLALGISS